MLGFGLVQILSYVLCGLTMPQHFCDIPYVPIIFVFRSALDCRHSNRVPELPENVTDKLPLMSPTLLVRFICRQ